MKHPLLLLLTATCHAAPSSGPATAASITSRKPLRFASPLQSFTLFDGEPTAPPRAKYLPRLRAGLLAEKRARERIAAEELRRGLLPSRDGDVADKGGGWAEHSAAEEERRKKVADATAEKAYDEAVAAFDARWIRSDGGAGGRCADGGHQFVGVIDAESQGVTWYARPKPKNAKWTLRIIHPNRDAILRDLFVGGKIDLFSRYENEGMEVAGGALVGEGGGGNVEGRKNPTVMARYRVRERSWRTLWNFSPVRYFTIPSGSYHRERRLTPGLYTDGTAVYESVYRYRDGKNGMKPVGLLEGYLGSLRGEKREGVEEKLRGSPDVVVEK